MYQNPVGEIEKYYGTKIIYEGLEISGESVLCDIRGRVMDITVMLEVHDISDFQDKPEAIKKRLKPTSPYNIRNLKKYGLVFKVDEDL